MKVAMPSGSFHGWGIAGESLAREISRLPPLENVTLHCIRGYDFEPFSPEEWGHLNIGYCFFEYPLLAYPFIRSSGKRWDHIVAGSTWCEEHLRLAGISSTSTVLQGIDHSRFSFQAPRRPDGRFIVFSGGKFEFRKGQDIVIAVMRRFMARHPDVWLSCAWHNPWPDSVQTMTSSPFILWQDTGCSDLREAIRHCMQREGIDTSRVIIHPPMPNEQMATIYRDSDIGLFPNRCEGGNNMVMCEYMACGRTVISSDKTGHADVISPDNSFPLSRYTPRPVYCAGRLAALWPEPDPDEILERLEEAYSCRDDVIKRGNMAAETMRRLDWKEAARRFHQIGSDLLLSRLPVHRVLETVEQLVDEGETGRAKRLLDMSERFHPADSSLLNARATIDDREGVYDQAIARYDRALATASPSESIEIRINRANTFARKGDFSRACTDLAEVIREHPGNVRALRSLAALHHKAAEKEEEFLVLARLMKTGEATPDEIHDLAGILQERRRFSEARSILESNLARWPDEPTLLNDLGLIYHETGEFVAARRAFLSAHILIPHDPAPCNNLGNLSKSLGNYTDALAWYERALRIAPGNLTVRFNRGLIHLLHGRFSEGWDDYEYRFHKIPPVILPHHDITRWDGSSLAGKRILVQSEQVYGDTLMFCRFLPLLTRMGAEVVFECQDHLIRPALSALEQQGIRLIVRGEKIPPVDCQIPLLSIPGILKTTVETIPFNAGYLTPPKESIPRWTELFRRTQRPRIGLVWGGRKAPLNADRSIGLQIIATLFSLPGIEWYSFQTGDDRVQITPFSGTIRDLSPLLTDFGETAAALQQMDLLLTVDTAIAHLAGALGVRTWVILKHDADWRWLLDRSDSPWYDSLRLWRQTIPGSWETIIPAIRDELEIFVSSIFQIGR